MVTFKINGKLTTTSVTKACKALGLFTYNQVRCYKDHNAVKSMDDAFYAFLNGYKPKKKGEACNERILEYNGKKQNMRDLCREHDISYGAFQRYLSDSNDVSLAVEKCRELKTKKEEKKVHLLPLTLHESKNAEETVYESIRKMCEDYDVKVSAVERLVKKGQSPTEALTNVLAKKASLCINGIQYRTFGEACQANGLTDQCVRQYAQYHDISLFRALRYLVEIQYQTKTRERAHEIVADDMVFPSLYQACMEYQLSYGSVVGYAFRYKLTHQEAFDHYRNKGTIWAPAQKLWNRLKGKIPKSWKRVEFSDGDEYISFVAACFYRDVMPKMSAIARKVWADKVSYEEAITYYQNQLALSMA